MNTTSPSALANFMANSLNLQDFQRINVISDNAKIPEVNSETPSAVQIHLSPTSQKMKRKSILPTQADKWGDLVNGDSKMSSVAIGNGSVAMQRQDSLERHFLKGGNEKRSSSSSNISTSLITVPEDESVHISLGEGESTTKVELSSPRRVKHNATTAAAAKEKKKRSKKKSDKKEKKTKHSKKANKKQAETANTA